MAHDDPSTKKYHQTVVPDHALKPDTSGTSFLRTGSFPSLTDPTKQPPGFQKSLALARLAGEHHLKTGGSWHHVDGNRIETTTGRKVEVIEGSYVAHRGPGNSPGPNFSATWATTSYTQVGSLDLPVGWTPGTPTVAPPPITADPGTDFVSRLSFNYNASFDRTFPDPNHPTTQQDPNASTDTTPPANSNLQPGDVAAVTWAQRILTYVGSVAFPVPLVYAETWASAYHSYSYYSVESKTYVGSDPIPVPEVLAWTHAGSAETKVWAHTGNITTWNHAVGSGGTVWQDTFATAINTTQEAAAITVANTAVNLFTCNTGIQEVINLAPAMLTFTLAGAVATMTVAGAIGNINVGEQLVINVPDRLQFTLSDGHIVLASRDMNAVQTNLNGIRTCLEGVANDVHGVSNQIAGTQTSLASTRAHLGAVATYLHGMTTLGS